MAKTLDRTDHLNETWNKRSRLGWMPGEKPEHKPQDETTSPCLDCEKADSCKRMCQKLKALVESKNGCSEIHSEDAVTILPEKGNIRNFTSKPAYGELENREFGVSFNTDGLNLSLTTVFVEYFFKRRPLKDIAEDMGVGSKTVHSTFTKAVERINTIISVLDARQSALKYTYRLSQYSDDEKAFLLTHIFGFTPHEVADLLGGKKAPATWQRRIVKKRKEMDKALNLAG